MYRNNKLRNRLALQASACALLAGGIVSTPAIAQDDDSAGDVIVVTGTRIQNPNIVAASPINTIGQDELNRKFTPNVERVFRDLPITIPGDGQNVNNGTQGQATVDLRGLGPQRSLVMIDGKRLSPFDINGTADVTTIPFILLDRVDIITGGASAVYGSDAMSGAINFILRDDFEGVEIDTGYSITEQGGGDIYDVSALFGSQLADGRGHVTVGGNYTSRGSVLLAQRDFGQFGVSSTTGSGLGSAPPDPAPDCSGNTDFSTAFSSGVGSTTAIPGTLNLRSGNSYQFRDDGSLVLGECARFNFNPFNYYQTPQERWQATAIAKYDISDNVEMYGRASFTSNKNTRHIAPSGTCGLNFTIPVMNPFFDTAARVSSMKPMRSYRQPVGARLSWDHAPVSLIPINSSLFGALEVNFPSFLMAGIMICHGNVVRPLSPRHVTASRI